MYTAHSAPTLPLSNQSHSGLACYRLLMLPVYRQAMPCHDPSRTLLYNPPSRQHHPSSTTENPRDRCPHDHDHDRVIIIPPVVVMQAFCVCVCLVRPSCSNDPEAGQHSSATLTPFPDQTKQKQCRGPNKEKESTPETRHQLNPAASFSACRPGPRNPS